MTTAKIIIGDCLESLAGMEDKSVHCCVTSPPYFGLRQYLFDKAVVLDAGLPREQRHTIEKKLRDLGVLPRSADGSVLKRETLEEAPRVP